MEYVDARTVYDEIVEDGSGVAGVGLVHRDVKPKNIMITKEGARARRGT